MKKEALRTALREVSENPTETVLLFTDEVSFYRQPTQAWLWHHLGRAQPRLPYSNRANTLMRVIGVLDAWNGDLQTWDCNKATAVRLGKCWATAVQSYPAAKKIYFVIDNWPVHFHPKARDRCSPIRGSKSCRSRLIHPGSTTSRRSGAG